MTIVRLAFITSLIWGSGICQDGINLAPAVAYTATLNPDLSVNGNYDQPPVYQEGSANNPALNSYGSSSFSDYPGQDFDTFVDSDKSNYNSQSNRNTGYGVDPRENLEIKSSSSNSLNSHQSSGLSPLGTQNNPRGNQKGMGGGKGIDLSQAQRTPDGRLCVIKYSESETVAKDPILECKHKNVEKCHYSYITQFKPTQEEICDENFEKLCQITFRKQAVKESVRKCYRPQKKVCNGQGPEECRTVFETSCSTRYIPKGYGKFVGDTKCEKLPVEICGAGCLTEEGPEECHDKEVETLLDIPEEVCDLNPQKTCRFATRLVPTLKAVPECTIIPQEICNLKFSQPRTEKKQLKSEWCLDEPPPAKYGALPSYQVPSYEKPPSDYKVPSLPSYGTLPKDSYNSPNTGSGMATKPSRPSSPTFKPQMPKINPPFSQREFQQQPSLWYNSPTADYGAPPPDNYGAPSQDPTPDYRSPPSDNYGPPSQDPTPGYGAPPPDNYGPPSQDPTSDYKAPPSDNYGPLFQDPTPDHGALPPNGYGPPRKEASPNYGAPPSVNNSPLPPSPTYGPPAAKNNGPPLQNPKSSYGAPTLDNYDTPTESSSTDDYVFDSKISQSKYSAPQQEKYSFPPHNISRIPLTQLYEGSPSGYNGPPQQQEYGQQYDDDEDDNYDKSNSDETYLAPSTPATYGAPPPASYGVQDNKSHSPVYITPRQPNYGGLQKNLTTIGY